MFTSGKLCLIDYALTVWKMLRFYVSLLVSKLGFAEYQKAVQQ